ncbi:hypothetical protein J6590_005646 [Homalodisca vitripennis]|nr:hypothetical protein J6590_005646 [Homalodisca vitripennis]
MTAKKLIDPCLLRDLQMLQDLEQNISWPLAGTGATLWGYAKEEVYQSKLRTLEEFESRIQELIISILIDFLQRSVNCILGHLRRLSTTPVPTLRSDLFLFSYVSKHM